jgi:two-component system, NarL family, response regulator DevR
MPKVASKRRTKPNRITVAILEDNATLVKGMKAELDQPDISICAVSDNVDQFLHELKSCQPMIAIVDLRIWKDFDAGFTTISAAKDFSPGTQYIVHTAYDVVENFHKGINLGIRAFVSKNIYEKPLDEVVRLVFNGGTYYGDLLSEYLDKLKESSIQLAFDGKDDSSNQSILSKKELEVLDLLDKELSVEAIAAELYVTKNTIKAHTKNIRGKLGTKTTPEAVRLYRLRKKGV